jgi:hypothetical protein
MPKIFRPRRVYPDTSPYIVCKAIEFAVNYESHVEDSPQAGEIIQYLLTFLPRKFVKDII